MLREFSKYNSLVRHMALSAFFALYYLTILKLSILILFLNFVSHFRYQPHWRIRTHSRSTNTKDWGHKLSRLLPFTNFALNNIQLTVSKNRPFHNVLQRPSGAEWMKYLVSINKAGWFTCCGSPIHLFLFFIRYTTGTSALSDGTEINWADHCSQ